MKRPRHQPWSGRWRFGLLQKVLLAFALLALLLVGVLAGTLYWSFERGFRDYLARSELPLLDPLARFLSRTYAVEGGWGSVIDEPALWPALTNRLGHEGDLPSDRVLTPRHQPPPPGRRPPGPLGPQSTPVLRASVRTDLPGRITLLDASQRPLLGPPEARPGSLLRRLEADGRTIGWLRLSPPPVSSAALDRAFRARHQRVILVTAGSALLLVLLLTVPLAAHLIGPVQTLARGMLRLTAGELDHRVDISRHDELGSLADGFNRMAAALEEHEQVRRRWVADVAHELRTPLAVLTGEVDALAEGVRPWNARAGQSLAEEVNRLNTLVDDLHQLAMSDLGALSCELVPMYLESFLADQIARQAPACADAGLRLTWSPAPRASLIRGDTRRLTQLIDNLFQNSCRYTDPGGEIRLSTRQTGSQVSIDLHDSAPGVPDAALDRLFERLYRVDKSRSREIGGSGLGLAICRGIVAAHQGRISARPSPLGGLWIEVAIPLQTVSIDLPSKARSESS